MPVPVVRKLVCSATGTRVSVVVRVVEAFLIISVSVSASAVGDIRAGELGLGLGMRLRLGLGMEEEALKEGIGSPFEGRSGERREGSAGAAAVRTARKKGMETVRTFMVDGRLRRRRRWRENKRGRK